MIHDETPSRIEPLFIDGSIPNDLATLALTLQQEACDLGRDLQSGTTAAMADIMRIVDCHYSNLIEGHDTHPIDIERALAGTDIDEDRRPLALEAKAHVEVQREIAAMHRKGDPPVPTSIEFIRSLHARFYAGMPAELRQMTRPGGGHVTVEAGEFRNSDEQDVVVGRHRPPSPARVHEFMRYFEKRYASTGKQPVSRIVTIATAHHRLNFIHPFPDGNGRVSRLMSHAMALQAGIGGHGLWSISRGLARGLADRGEYKRMMDHADMPRQGDRDGRGNLSERALRDFVEWFLTAALNQVRFSAALFNLAQLEERLRSLAKDVSGDSHAPDLLAAVLRHGSMPREAAVHALRTSDRAAGSTLVDLIGLGLLNSDSPDGSVAIALPLEWRERLLPDLFGDAEIGAPSPAGLGR